MACNCATDEMIKRLYEKYGTTKDKTPKTLSEKLKIIFRNIALYIISVPLIVYFTVIILYRGLVKNEKINLFQLLGVNNGGEQQMLQGKN